MDILIALNIAFLLDLTLGDPFWMPHTVTAIGKSISLLERLLRRILPAKPADEILGGALLAIAVLSFWTCLAALLLAAAGAFHPALRFALECFLCWQMLAAKCLAVSAANVHAALDKGNLPGARKALSLIVGRDTAKLSAPAAARAAVETVAENTSDAVVAPMLFFALGGAPLAVAYKAINTMDSMIGYKNEKYRFFGRAAARLDDIANFIPARLTALLMIPAAALCGLDWKNTLRIGRRDGSKHASPNAGHPESACAGALGVWLGGESAYGGTPVKKPVIGEGGRETEPADILRANRLLYATASVCFFLCCAIIMMIRL